MIEGFFFFRLTRKSDGFNEYRIARSLMDLYERFGSRYLSRYYDIVKLCPVTDEHIYLINEFLQFS